MNMPFEQQQLQFVEELAKHRPEFLNPFFLFLNYFDSPYFFFVLIPVVWLGFSYSWGIRIFFWFSLSNVVNSLAKVAFGLPRPSQILPEIGLLQPTSFGFPSGGAQTAMFLGALLIYFWPRKSTWIIAIIYIALISFSRLYLGVHFPLDILGGWFFGLLLLAILIVTKEPLERFIAKANPLFILLLVIAISLAIMITFPKIQYIMSSFIGIGLGIYVSTLYQLYLDNPKTLFEAIGRSFIGLFFLFLSVGLWPAESQSIFKSFSVALFMSLFASPFCLWTMKKTL